MFFQAVVENNNDPNKLGRVQIRIVGKHTENRKSPADDKYYPVSDLPWAEIAMPPNSPFIDGQSDYYGLKNGTIVYGFFKDKEEQFPVVFGVALRIPEEKPDYTKGFSDPDKVYPSILNESPINRLARNENIEDSIIQEKLDNVTSCTANGVSIDEPDTPYNAEYPHNKVIATKSHIIELDDTGGSERIHIYHKSGTFIEVHPDGTEVEKVKATKYLIIEDDKKQCIGGDRTTKVAGSDVSQVRDFDMKSETSVKITCVNAEIIADSDFTVDTPQTSMTGNLDVVGNITGANLVASSGTIVAGNTTIDPVNGITTNALTVTNQTADDNGAIGSYAFMKCDSVGNVEPGDSVPGSSLRYAELDDSLSSTVPSGTWRCMGYIQDEGSGGTTLFTRIS